MVCHGNVLLGCGGAKGEGKKHKRGGLLARKLVGRLLFESAGKEHKRCQSSQCWVLISIRFLFNLSMAWRVVACDRC